MPMECCLARPTFETLLRLNSTQIMFAFYVFLFFGLQLALHCDIPTYSVKNLVKMVIKLRVYYVTYQYRFSSATK